MQNGLALSTTSVQPARHDPPLDLGLGPEQQRHPDAEQRDLYCARHQRDDGAGFARQTLLSESATDDTLRARNANAQFDNLSTQADLMDASRVEIVTGGAVEFQSQSLTLAQGGQVAVSAVNRAQVDAGRRNDRRFGRGGQPVAERQ